MPAELFILTNILSNTGLNIFAMNKENTKKSLSGKNLNTKKDDNPAMTPKINPLKMP